MGNKQELFERRKKKYKAVYKKGVPFRKTPSSRKNSE